MKTSSIATILSIFMFFSINGCVSRSQTPVNPEWTGTAERAMRSVALVEVAETISGYPDIKSIGTAFAITSDGYLLTNVHVVEATLRMLDPQVRVTFENGDAYFVKKKILLPEFDVAILKIQAKGIPFLEFEFYREVKRGEHVLSLGNPWPFNYAVTEGVVASTKYQLNPSNKFKWIQIDNHLNPGMSGGPTIDRSGKIIGINQAIGARHQGVSLLIPAIELHQTLVESLPANALNMCLMPEEDLDSGV